MHLGKGKSCYFLTWVVLEDTPNQPMNRGLYHVVIFETKSEGNKLMEETLYLVGRASVASEAKIPLHLGVWVGLLDPQTN